MKDDFRTENSNQAASGQSSYSSLTWTPTLALHQYLPPLGVQAYAVGPELRQRQSVQPPATINIPGVPRLYSRGKASFLFNKLMDHFAVVFASGPGGEPQPNDPVFELQLSTGHTECPIPYRKFCNGEVPVPHDIQIDSKADVIARLDAFYKNPKKWKIRFNCEHFARWLLTGVAVSKQVERAAKVSLAALEAFTSVLAGMAEAYLKLQKEERERIAQQAVQPMPVIASPPETNDGVVKGGTPLPTIVALRPVVTSPARKKRKKPAAQGRDLLKRRR